MASKMSRRTMAAFAALLVIFWLYKFGMPNRDRNVENPYIVNGGSRPRNLSYLTKNIDLSSEFQYTQRTIRTKYFVGDRPDLTTMNDTLFPPFQTLTKADLSDVQCDSMPPLTLDVPASPKLDTSIFTFGCATSIPRLNMSLKQLSHWLPNTGSSIHILSSPDESPDPESSRLALQARALSLAMDLTITPSTAPFPVAYFGLIKHLYDHRNPQTEWVVLIDDDTFIPSLSTLTKHLTRYYDSSKPELVAAITEDWNQINEWGMIPFGGGGIFISTPLAALLSSPEIWEQCKGGFGQNQGDGVLSKCLNEFTSVRPKFDTGLNQMDIRGSPAGLFESGRRMLTVHHWRSWFHVNVERAAIVAGACGDECIFQRWAFGNESLVLTNGYSIVQYPNGVEKIDFRAVEKTWEGEKERFLHHVGPLREHLPAEEKVRYELVDSETLPGGVRQLYHRRRKEGISGEKGMDAIMELFWLRS